MDTSGETDYEHRLSNLKSKTKRKLPYTDIKKATVMLEVKILSLQVTALSVPSGC